MQTLYDKIWNQHLVCKLEAGASLIYIDRHLIHEVTSPQAFEGLRNNNRRVRAPQRTLAVADHNVPTIKISNKIKDPESALQIQTLIDNCKEFGIECYNIGDKRQGIVHIVGPEQGFTLPGTTIVCGDSHTSTHGAFGALAHGIGTSEVEHVLATQTLIQKKSKNMKINIKGKITEFVTAKDIILSIIGKIGTAGATGYVIEYAGDIIKKLSMSERMTICNMSIEAGAKAGLIQPDQITFEFLKDKPKAPKKEQWIKAVESWKKLYSDQDAVFDKEVTIDVENLSPLVTWGTSPQQVVDIDGHVPYIDDIEDENKKASIKRSLDYMGLEQGTPIKNIEIDRVFIGSCTNSRIEDLRKVAQIIKGYKVHPNVKAMIVPGSGLVKQQAEQEKLDQIFLEGEFEWREPGCSMCLAMNDDKLEPGQRCASTSNRNFEGRQGRGGRTHLVSPQMAAAAAIKGRFYDVRKWQFQS